MESTTFDSGNKRYVLLPGDLSTRLPPAARERDDGYGWLCDRGCSERGLIPDFGTGSHEFIALFLGRTAQAC
ncbi:hypothetical protein C0Z16_34655 [Paraburkholderia rhynchosiae]|uniref:Uncharacterized protein n=1 Tax=Paraburkholderia rhynchosiae TaxID=487049 RepID=A0ABX4UU40_9BURK|nr:hypothetical protein C0Z16_34655 [Paraburkholderia rhynchosiae]